MKRVATKLLKALPRKSWRRRVVMAGVICLFLAACAYGFYQLRTASPSNIDSTTSSSTPGLSEESSSPTKPGNPLSGRNFYIDRTREVNKVAAQYRQDGQHMNAELLDRIANQPGTTWLTGPSSSDVNASEDVAEVNRTSTEAARQGTVPVYELYAIPGRDACASYSKGGFKTNQEYLVWVDNILATLQSEAVFSVEADAVAHNIQASCLTARQVNERYALLRDTLAKLKASPKVLAVYIDAGHSEWFPDPAVLVEPLRKAGVEQARGIVVNVSFFVANHEITAWSQRLVGLIGGDKGVMIDTSRNGRGVPPTTLQGEARWCNPKGRGIGSKPTTYVADPSIDAYFWGKNIGESDGSCFGKPAAGVFVPELALELARNASSY